MKNKEQQKRFKQKFKIRKGDNVRVIAGSDKGKEGRVLEVLTKNNRLIVEGINIVSKHTKPNAENPEGGIVKQEAPIHMSNVMLLVGGRTTRVGRKVVDGKVKRYAKITDELID